MTNAIEQTKREMYASLKNLKVYADSANQGASIACEYFERFLELHLEELRKAMVAGNENTIRCANHSLVTIRDLESRLATMTEERDAIQLRLHAVDHAYNEQQRKTGTCGQVCADRGASEQTDGKTMALLGVIVECQQLVSDWAIYGYRAKKQMKKMAYVLNNNPELRAALDHFEGRS